MGNRTNFVPRPPTRALPLTLLWDFCPHTSLCGVQKKSLNYTFKSLWYQL